MAKVGTRRYYAAAGVAAAGLGLFAGYLRMARAIPTNADGSSIAMQAWDVLHGNVGLHGWTLASVTFYSTEMLQHALLELLLGYRSDVVHVAAAMTYTLMVLLVATLAKGRATGVTGAIRVAVAVAIMLVPAPEVGTQTLLSSPAHFGTGVPLLITWIVLERAVTGRDAQPRVDPGRWLPYAIAALLTWGQIADPLVTYVGALPLVVVTALRLWRPSGPDPTRARRLDLRLLVAGVASTLLAHVFLATLQLTGGFSAYPALVDFAPVSQLADRASLTVALIGVIFGAHLPEMHSGAALALGVLHLVGILAVVAAVGIVVTRLLRRAVARRAPGEAQDRINELLAVGIAANLAAYLFSSLSADLLAAREIVLVLPLGAALAGRVCADRLRAWRLTPALVALLVVLGGAFVFQAREAGVPAANSDIAQWLSSRNLSYGLGSYWSANNITLGTSGRVTVVPVSGNDPVRAFRWESRIDWYDPARHDARFVILDLSGEPDRSAAAAITQLGPPTERRDFGAFVVLVYDHNLLVGLPALCGPGVVAPSMAACPR